MRELTGCRKSLGISLTGLMSAIWLVGRSVGRYVMIYKKGWEVTLRAPIRKLLLLELIYQYLMYDDVCMYVINIRS